MYLRLSHRDLPPRSHNCHGLPPHMPHPKFSPHVSPTCLHISPQGWGLVGPPHLQRYARCIGGSKPPWRSDRGETKRSVGAQLQAVRALFTSPPFAALLSQLAGRTPRAYRAEVRRFRPGLDYTLAHEAQTPAGGQTQLEVGRVFVNWGGNSPLLAPSSHSPKHPPRTLLASS